MGRRIWPIAVVFGCVLAAAGPGEASPAGFDPAVSTGPATGVTADGAELHGTISPNGAETNYYFEWGTTSAYGQQSTETADLSTDTQDETADAQGLTPGTTYHYRIVAVDQYGTSFVYGSDRTFTTTGTAPPGQSSGPTCPGGQPGGGVFAPTVRTGGAWVGSSDATLQGTICPNGAQTNYYFEWGTTSAYGQQSTETAILTFDGPQNETADAQGLSPGTTYHYRIVAVDQYGTSFVYGSDAVFTTLGRTSTTSPSPAPDISRLEVAKSSVSYVISCGRSACKLTSRLRLVNKPTMLASRFTTVKPGHRARLTLRLDAAGRRLLRRNGTLTAELVVSASRAGGHKTSRIQQVIHFTATRAPQPG